MGGPSPELLQSIVRAADAIRRRHHELRPDLVAEPPPRPTSALAALQFVVVERDKWLEMEARDAAQTGEWLSLKEAAFKLGKSDGAFRMWFRRHGRQEWRRRGVKGFQYQLGAITGAAPEKPV